LAQYARAPGSRDKPAGILAQNPQLQNPLLLSLAADPYNADPVPDGRAWQARFILALVSPTD